MARNRPSSAAAKLVVVIDDNSLVLEATSGLLHSWGFHVVAARCFEEALEQLGRSGRRPDLIVSDYRLSKGETGIDAIEGLRNAFEIPALLISGDSVSAPCEADRDGYQLLQKPVNAEALRTALADACRLRLKEGAANASR